MRKLVSLLLIVALLSVMLCGCSLEITSGTGQKLVSINSGRNAEAQNTSTTVPETAAVNTNQMVTPQQNPDGSYTYVVNNVNLNCNTDVYRYINAQGVVDLKSMANDIGYVMGSVTNFLTNVLVSFVSTLNLNVAQNNGESAENVYRVKNSVQKISMNFIVLSAYTMEHLAEASSGSQATTTTVATAQTY